jgi:hypothetical protein
MRLVYLLALLAVPALAQGIQIKSGASTDTATVNAAKSLLVVRGASSLATYSCTATGLVTTAAYSMQLDAEAGRGFKVQKVCVGTSAATAAALQTTTIQRRTTASTGGTAATQEGTASPAVSKFDPADGNWTGRCAQTPTLGTAGAVLDGWGWTVPEIGAGAADPGSQFAWCKTYGDESEKAPTVVAGTANGISVLVGAAGAGGLASGSITIIFTAYP